MKYYCLGTSIIQVRSFLRISCCSLKKHVRSASNPVLQVANRVHERNKEFVSCMIFSNTEPLYTTPCDSRIVGVYKVRLSAGNLKTLTCRTAANKAICYTDYERSELVFIQLLHTI